MMRATRREERDEETRVDATDWVDELDSLVTAFDWGMNALTWVLVVVFGVHALGGGNGPFRPARWLHALLALTLATAWIWARPWSATLTCLVALVFGWFAWMLLRRTRLAVQVENYDRARRLTRRLGWLLPNTLDEVLDVLDEATTHFLEGRSDAALRRLDDLPATLRAEVETETPFALAMARNDFSAARQNCLDRLTATPTSAAPVPQALEAMLWMPNAEGCVELFERHVELLNGPLSRWSCTLEISRLRLATACGLEDDAMHSADTLPLMDVDREFIRMRCRLAQGLAVDREALDALRRDATPIQRWTAWHIASMAPHRVAVETASRAQHLIERTRSSWFVASADNHHVTEWLLAFALGLLALANGITAAIHTFPPAP